MAALVSAVTKQVQEHEPDTLLYYAFQIEKTNEIVVVDQLSQSFRGPFSPPEGDRASAFSYIQVFSCHQVLIRSRYKHQAAVQAHMKAPYFREFAGKLPALLAKPTELKAGGFLGGWRGVSRL